MDERLWYEQEKQNWKGQREMLEFMLKDFEVHKGVTGTRSFQRCKDEEIRLRFKQKNSQDCGTK